MCIYLMMPIMLKVFSLFCSVIAIDHDDIGKDDPMGGIVIPLYEVIPGKRIKLHRLFDEPTKVRFYGASCI